MKKQDYTFRYPCTSLTVLSNQKDFRGMPQNFVTQTLLLCFPTISSMNMQNAIKVDFATPYLNGTQHLALFLSSSYALITLRQPVLATSASTIVPSYYFTRCTPHSAVLLPHCKQVRWPSCRSPPAAQRPEARGATCTSSACCCCKGVAGSASSSSERVGACSRGERIGG